MEGGREAQGLSAAPCRASNGLACSHAAPNHHTSHIGRGRRGGGGRARPQGPPAGKRLQKGVLHAAASTVVPVHSYAPAPPSKAHSFHLNTTSAKQRRALCSPPPAGRFSSFPVFLHCFRPRPPQTVARSVPKKHRPPPLLKDWPDLR